MNFIFSYGTFWEQPLYRVKVSELSIAGSVECIKLVLSSLPAHLPLAYPTVTLFIILIELEMSHSSIAK